MVEMHARVAGLEREQEVAACAEHSVELGKHHRQLLGWRVDDRIPKHRSRYRRVAHRQTGHRRQADCGTPVAHGFVDLTSLLKWSLVISTSRHMILTARAEELIDEAGGHLARADDAVRAHPDVRHGGYLHDAKKEFAEANLTFAFVAGHPMPTARELGVDAPAYLNGMAEAASELRRQVLDCLRADDMVESERLLGLMDDVYMVLVTVDYPDALTGGLRRSTDALRAVLERTRGDVTNALVIARLQAAEKRQQSTRKSWLPSFSLTASGGGASPTGWVGATPPDVA